MKQGRGTLQGVSREDCIALATLFQCHPTEIIDWWEERAAIREFEGGQDRQAAEHDALRDIELALREGRKGPKSAQLQGQSKRKAE